MNKEIKLQVKDKQANAYLADGKGPGILVLHAWWGLKPFFKQFCDRLAKEGFTVLAPDLYQGRTANTIDEAKALMEQRDFELMQETVKAAKDHLVSLHAGRPIGVLGFSMGAAWSMAVAAHEQDVSTMVLFYGVSDEDFSRMKAKVLAHFAEEDEWESLEDVRSMETAMKAAGLDVTLHLYPKAGHWFMEEDRPEYDPAAAQMAWERTVEFLKKSL